MIGIILLQAYIGSKKYLRDEDGTIDWCEIDSGLLQTFTASTPTFLTQCKLEKLPHELMMQSKYVLLSMK